MFYEEQDVLKLNKRGSRELPFREGLSVSVPSSFSRQR